MHLDVLRVFDFQRHKHLLRLEPKMLPPASMKLLAFSFLAAKILSAQIQVLGIATSSDFSPILPSPGSLASVFVSGLTGISGIVQASGYPLPYNLGGISVTVYGTPAPILAVADVGGSYQQINIQVPFSSDINTLIQVTQSGQVGTFAPPGNSGLWGVFFANATRQGVLQHADYSLVTAANPAKPGEVLVAYATDLAAYNAISNAPPIGMPANATPLPAIDNPGVWELQVYVNSQLTTSQYTGLTPSLAGVFQVNFVVPALTGAGTASLQIIDFPSCFGFSDLCPEVKKSNSVTFPVGSAN